MDLQAAVDAAGLRVLERIRTLAGISEKKDWIERVLFSTSAEEAAYRLKRWMEEAGMTVEYDALTNVYGRLYSSPDGPVAPFIHLGSHYDTVINAGAYDGALGVLLAIAVAEVVRDAGLPLNHNLGALAFCDEEGVRFQSTFLGSAYLSGQFQKEWLDLPDDKGKTLGEWLVDRAESIDDLLAADPVVRSQDYFLEPHIEQGPVLEATDKPLGVFTRIAAQMRSEVEIIGEAGHAGTTPARLRRDPLPLACELILAVSELCRSDERIRATVGQVEVRPNASNVIPGRVRFTIDLRFPNQEGLQSCHFKLVTALEAIARRSDLEYRYRVVHRAADVQLDSTLTQALCEASRQEHSDAVRLFSGAGHDSMKIAQVCPVAMLAVRCRNGLSHHPDEHASDEDCLLALRVLVRAVLDLDRKL